MSVPAAQYLRMSTEHQNYSLDNQAAAICCRGGHKDTTSCKKATNSRLVWRAAVLPWTRPVAVLSAAYKESVPWR